MAAFQAGDTVGDDGAPAPLYHQCPNSSEHVRYLRVGEGAEAGTAADRDDWVMAVTLCTAHAMLFDATDAAMVTKGLVRGGRRS